MKFEWQARFLAAPPSFYSHPAPPAAPSADGAVGDRRQQRLVRMLRNRRRGRHSKAGYVLGHRSDSDSEADEEQRQVTAAVSPSMAALSDPGVARLSMRSSVTDAPAAASSVQPEADNSVSTEQSGAPPLSRTPGQSLAPHLFGTLDRGVRPILRRMHDFTFLRQLETLLIRYKRRRVNAATAAAMNHNGCFIVLAPPGYETAVREEQQRLRGASDASAAGDDLFSDAEVLTCSEVETDDGAVLVECSSASMQKSSPPRRRRLSSSGGDGSVSDLPLSLVFADSFHRLLAHAVIRFHQLKSVSRPAADGGGYRTTLVQRERGGIAHRARLETFLIDEQRAHSIAAQPPQRRASAGDAALGIAAAVATAQIHNHSRSRGKQRHAKVARHL